MKIQEVIDNLGKEAKDKTQEAERLTKLLELYPDLELKSGRWNKQVYSSKSVNSKVDNFDHRYNCGCCPDSPCEVWPYLDTEYGQVHSSPAFFFVGERNDYASTGTVSTGKWEDEMRKEQIPESVIDKVKLLFSVPNYDDEE